MDNPGFVRGPQPSRDLPDDRQGLPDRQRTFPGEHVGEIGALDVGHRDVFDAADFAEVVDAHHVRVGDQAREQQLLFETALDLRGRLRVFGRGAPNHLQCQRNFEFRVPGLVDGAHAAHAEHLDDVVSAAEGCTNRERPAFSRRRTSGRGGARKRDVGIRSRETGDAGGRDRRATELGCRVSVDREKWAQAGAGDVRIERHAAAVTGGRHRRPARGAAVLAVH